MNTSFFTEEKIQEIKNYNTLKSKKYLIYTKKDHKKKALELFYTFILLIGKKLLDNKEKELQQVAEELNESPNSTPLTTDDSDLVVLYDSEENDEPYSINNEDETNFKS